MKGRTIDELKIGDESSFEKTISESDVYLFAGISGDNNPAHVNERYMKDSVFKGRIAHGILTAGLISAVLGTRLPGPGSIYLKQELNFRAPVKIGDSVQALVRVKEIHKEKNRISLETICTNQDGKTVLDGIAVVKPPQ